MDLIRKLVGQKFRRTFNNFDLKSDFGGATWPTPPKMMTDIQRRLSDDNTNE